MLAIEEVRMNQRKENDKINRDDNLLLAKSSQSHKRITKSVDILTRISYSSTYHLIKIIKDKTYINALGKPMFPDAGHGGSKHSTFVLFWGCEVYIYYLLDLSSHSKNVLKEKIIVKTKPSVMQQINQIYHVIKHILYIMNAVYPFQSAIWVLTLISITRSSPTKGLLHGSNEACHLREIVLTREPEATYAQERARIQKVRVAVNGRMCCNDEEGKLEMEGECTAQRKSMKGQGTFVLCPRMHMKSSKCLGHKLDPNNAWIVNAQLAIQCPIGNPMPRNVLGMNIRERSC
ncbi:hypothetical protein D8674_000025 [Pyrus ussuriensis x Pyrus communis]|uniref:Uncharacterized protein n=1 Tax=Pyrus ussuriensis x Pyrus communis TaxID=2448454 RepID=A0A5N5F299_9ROSA|nr:hypothetical protein D8674_000025 [Pyrus ussuriensis x Pyrus communis]